MRANVSYSIVLSLTQRFYVYQTNTCYCEESTKKLKSWEPLGIDQKSLLRFQFEVERLQIDWRQEKYCWVKLKHHILTTRPTSLCQGFLKAINRSTFFSRSESSFDVSWTYCYRFVHGSCLIARFYQKYLVYFYSESLLLSKLDFLALKVQNVCFCGNVHVLVITAAAMKTAWITRG